MGTLLILSIPDARAGTYAWQTTDPSGNTAQSPTYTGATYYGLGGQYGAPGTYPDAPANPGYGGGASMGGGTAACSGTITATLTWQADPNLPSDPPPPPNSVIVTETCTAKASALSSASGSATSGCDDGLGEPGSVQTGQGVAQYSGGPNRVVTGYYASASAADVRYTAGGGKTITLSASPSGSSATSGGESSSASVCYTPAASPVTVSLGGTLRDNSGNLILDSSGYQQVLTGQQITATLAGIPGGFTVTKYTWAVGGDAFKTYNEKAASNQLVPLGSADLTNTDTTGSGISVTPLAFYDSAAESLTVTCAITVTAPDGTSLSLTAASPQIDVQKPTLTRWDIAEGYVQYDPNYNSEQYGPIQTYGLYGDLSGTGNSTNGMIWSNVTVSVPAPFSGGLCTFTQLVNPDHLGYNGSSSTALLPYNGILGLDSEFEYGPPWSPPALGSDIDSPSIIVGQTGGPQQNRPGFTQLSVSDAFTTYVMYQPSGGVWIPLEKFSWSWSVTLNWQNSQWNLTASYPHTAGQAGTPTHVPTNDPPQWTVIQHT